MKTIVTKGEYAAQKQRAPSSVSNWIAEGKITRAALIGSGPRARIWVEQADADLARSLDPTQQLTQTHPVLPTLQPSLPADQASPGAAKAEALDADLIRRRKADADRAEHDAEAARRRNAVDEGRWIDAATAAREWTKELARLYTDLETFLAVTLARALAERHGLDWKVLSVEIRDHYRRHCGETAADARIRRDALEHGEELPVAAE